MCTRCEKEAKLTGKFTKLVASPKHPLMIFDAQISEEAQVTFLTKDEVEQVQQKQKKSGAKNITQFTDTGRGKMADADKVKFGTKSIGGRGVGYAVQYMSIMVPPSKAGEKPKYMKIQCINRSGSSFSFKMDAMSTK